MSLDVKEVVKKLAYHHQMASAWEYLGKHTSKFLSDSVSEVIPVANGVTATKVSLPCLEEVKQALKDMAKEHRDQIEELEGSKLAPMKLVAGAKAGKKDEEEAQDG